MITQLEGGAVDAVKAPPLTDFNRLRNDATFQGLVLAGQRAESGSKFQESWISMFGHGGA